MNMKKLSILLISLFMLVITVYSASAVNLTDGLVSYWKFDENTGTNAEDSVGTNDGTLINSPEWTTGKINNGIETDTTKGVRTEPPARTSQDFSYSTWIYPTTTGGSSVTFVHAGATSITANNRWFLAQNNLVVRLFLNQDGSNRVDANTGNVLTLNEWNHIILTREGITAKIYVNGEEEGSYSVSNWNIWGNDNLFIGALDTTSDINTLRNGFPGTIDEPAIYDRAISQEEITALYNNGDGTQYPFTATPDVNITFDVGTTNTSVVFNETIYYNVTVEGNMTNATLFIYNTTSLVHSEFIDNTTGSSPYKITGEFNLTNEGVYYMNASATDVNNLTVSTETRQIIYDISPPVINFTAFENNSWFRSIDSVPDIIFTATDPLPMECKYTIDFGVTNTSINCTDEVVNETWVWGFNYITFYATDLSNKTTQYNLVFSIRQVLNVIFKDETTFQNITNAVTFEFISDTLSQNYTTTNSTLSVLIPYNYTTIIRYNSEGYSERFYYVNFESLLPSPDYGGIDEFNLTLYLLNSSISSNVTITVFDTSGAEPIADVYIKYLKYDITTNSYINVGMTQTGLDGIAHLDVMKATEFYKFMIYYPIETLRTTTAPYYIYEDKLNIQLNLLGTIGESFATIIGVTSEIIYNNETENFRFTFSNTAGTDISPTFTVSEITRTGKTIINSTTTTSSAGTVLLKSPNVEGKTYIAEAVLVVDDNTYMLASSEKSNPQDAGWGLAGLVAIIILTIVFISIGYFNLNVALILAPMPMLFGVMIGFVNIAMPIAVSLQVLAIFIVMVINK